MKKDLINKSTLKKIIFQEMKSFLEKKPIFEEIEKIEKSLSLIDSLNLINKEIKSINECDTMDETSDQIEIEIEEVVADPVNNKPIFQVKGSSLIEDENEPSEDGDTSKWLEFEKALNELDKKNLKEEFKEEDEDIEDIDIEFDEEGNVNLGEPLPIRKSNFKKIEKDEDEYSRLYADLSEKMELDEASEMIDSIKEKEKKDKELQEAFNRMKRFL